MPRSRMIKPEFWDDEKLAKLSRDTRLFYIGLWTHSDDYGVVKGNAVWLRNHIFPYETSIPPAHVQKWLDDLEKIDRIRGFSHSEERFYYIKNFPVHQKVDHPSRQRNPEPPSEVITMGSRDTREDSRDIRDETEVNISKTEVKQKTTYDQTGFDRWWGFYPRKVAKKAALKVWKSINPDEALSLRMEVALQKHITVEWNDRPVSKIPHPSTYLNAARWEDETYASDESTTKHRGSIQPTPGKYAGLPGEK